MKSERAGSTRGALAAVASACGIVGLTLRGLVHGDLYALDPLLAQPVLDDAAYLSMARSLVEGGAGAWFLAPLHPWIAARLATFLELDLALLGGLNAVAGGLTSAVVALLAARLAGLRGGLCAGLIHALAGTFVFHDVLPGQEPLLGLLFAVACLAALRLERTGDELSAGALGLLIGVAMLGRGTSVALLLAAVPGLRRSERPRRAILSLTAGLILALAPATVRNLVVADAMTPFPSSGGANIYLASGPDSRAAVAFAAHEMGNNPVSIQQRSLAIASRAEGRDLGPYEASAWWRARAWADRGSAAEALAHLGRKALLFLDSEERGSNHDERAERGFSAWLGWTLPGGWWLLCLAGGAWWLVRTGRPEADVIALPIAGTWGLLTLFFPLARYRLPAAVLGVVLIGAALALISRARPGRRIVALGLVLVLAGAAFLPIRERDRGTGHVNVALALAATPDRGAEVRQHVERALDVAPRNGPAHELMGQILLEDGHAQEAFDHFVIAAQDGRTRLSAQVAALPAMAALGRLDQAERAAQGLLRELPEHPILLAHAAVVAFGRGDRQTAATRLQKAQSIAPTHPAVQRAAALLR